MQKTVSNFWIRLAACAIVAIVLVYFFPIFRIRKLEPSGNASKSLSTGAGQKENGNRADSGQSIEAFIESLWSERIPQAAADAATVTDVLALAATDPAGAQKKFGRQIGLGGPAFFFLRGSGRIEAVSEEECRLTIDGIADAVVLEIGILVSNAVRDATGLVNVDDFSNSQDFNQLSSELNARCELQVIEPMREKLIVGATVEFVGCGEVRDHDDFHPLKLIPVQLKKVADSPSTP